MKIWHLAYGVYWLPPAVIRCPWGPSRRLVLEVRSWQRKGKIGAAQISSQQRMLSLGLLWREVNKDSTQGWGICFPVKCSAGKGNENCQAPVRWAAHSRTNTSRTGLPPPLGKPLCLILRPNGGELLYIRVPEVPRQCFSCTYFQVWFFYVDSKTVLCAIMVHLL